MIITKKTGSGILQELTSITYYRNGFYYQNHYQKKDVPQFVKRLNFLTKGVMKTTLLLH